LSKSLFQKCSNKHSIPSESLDTDIGQIFEEIENCSYKLEPVVSSPSSSNNSAAESSSNSTLPEVHITPLSSPNISDPDAAHSADGPPIIYFENKDLVNIPNLSASIIDVDTSSKYRGRGGFGFVRRAYLVDGNNRVPVATKTLQYRKDPGRFDQAVWMGKKLPRRFLSEVRVWRDLDHKNILKFHGLAESQKHGLPLSMVSPWIDKGNVTEYLRQNPSTRRLPLIEGVAEGIQFLHNKGVVHGDIKGPNILVSDDLEPLLCDFGLAKFCDTYDVQNVSSSIRSAGSIRYMAIELISESGAKRSNGSDMWAFSMTCIEILTTQVPYADCPRDIPVMMKIVNEILPEKPTGCPDVLWTFMRRCWNKSVEERPTSQDAVVLLSRLPRPRSPAVVTYNVIDHPLA